jgi:DNA repair photolyase
MYPLAVSPVRMRHTGQDAQTPLFEKLPPGLPVVQRFLDRQRLLQRGPYADEPDVLSVQHLQGCVHGCGFCASRWTGGDVVRLAVDAAARVQEELRELPALPRAVVICPWSDPFPPLNEIQLESVRLVEVFANEGVESWLMTRGTIRPAARAVLAAHGERVKVTVPLTTMDRSLQRLLEPLTASPSLRLRMLHDLRRAGVGCQVALEPLIPGVTDTRENLLPLLEALDDAGVCHVTAGYLYLRPSIEATLQEVLQPHGLDGLALDEFAQGRVVGSGRGAIRYLARSRRQHGYAALMALAAGVGISVGINPLTNPDFTPAPRLAKLR